VLPTVLPFVPDLTLELEKVFKVISKSLMTLVESLEIYWETKRTKFQKQTNLEFTSEVGKTCYLAVCRTNNLRY
jgi:hypothetical protein